MRKADAHPGRFFVPSSGGDGGKGPSPRRTPAMEGGGRKDYDWLGGVITKHYQGDDSDLKLMAGGLLKAYEGATIEEFETTVGKFLRSARHPLLKRPYLDCAYPPMIELLRYLEANGFTNHIASGGARDFMRPITQDLYGIPPATVLPITRWKLPHGITED